MNGDKETHSIEYWKFRLLIDALEKVVLPDDPKPGISAFTKKTMRELLAGYSFRWDEFEEDECISSKLEQLNFMAKTESSAEESASYNKWINMELKNLMAEITDARNTESSEKSSLLSKWILIELKKLMTEIVDVYKLKLKESDDPKHKHLLENISTSTSRNPLDLIQEAILEEMLEEAELDKEIEKWTKARNEQLEACESASAEMKDMIRNFRKDFTSGKHKSVTDEYLDYLKAESECLQTKQKLLKIKQKIAETPTDVATDLAESYESLLIARQKIENYISEMETKKAKYENLGPEFQRMLNEWKEYGKVIEQKEWVLSQLEESNTSQDSLNNSMTFTSPG